MSEFKAKNMIQFLSILGVCVLWAAPVLSRAADAKLAVDPLRQAHSHNDYEQTRPLLEALDNGFCSVEADIYLVSGQLLVAHDRAQVRPERTLQALYLDPLRERVQRNGGRVYKGGPPIVLLIDVKSEAEQTYAALHEVLLQYTNILTRFTQNAIETNAITAIVSGNRSRAALLAQPIRFAALDGRPADLNGGDPVSLIPLVSEDWKSLFAWRGRGPLPDSDAVLLRSFVSKAHAQGRMLRFWGTADHSEVWGEMLAAHVDLINTDKLAELRHFLLASPKAATP